MFTQNDAILGILHSCSDDLESSKLVYYMYMYQIAGLNFSFRYKLNAFGLTSKSLDAYLNEVISYNKVESCNGVVSLTSEGELYYNNILLTAEEWDKLDFIKNVLDRMTEQELFLICITDMMVYETLESYGVDALIRKKNEIKHTIASLCKEYTDDNFDAALKFIRAIKEDKEL